MTFVRFNLYCLSEPFCKLCNTDFLYKLANKSNIPKCEMKYSCLRKYITPPPSPRNAVTVYVNVTFEVHVWFAFILVRCVVSTVFFSTKPYDNANEVLIYFLL